MNSTWIKIAIAYTAGMITYAVYQNHEETERLDKLITLSSDVSLADTSEKSLSCACEDGERYNVTPKERSENFPIDNVGTCQAMVNGSGPTIPEANKGVWFSKITLDLIFCHAPDANGIFVYKATMPGSTKDQVYVHALDRYTEWDIIT
ncbi:MAG: hypothetical protein NTV09_06450 [Bacteroidetes bacterium]|nr:hypothetical protein [Bacteroidota bacterium]